MKYTMIDFPLTSEYEDKISKFIEEGFKSGRIIKSVELAELMKTS